MKVALVLVALVAAVSAKPMELDAGCDSTYCEALQHIYNTIPTMFGQMETQVCDAASSALSHLVGSGIGHFLDGLCMDFLQAEGTQIIALIRQRIAQQGQADDCNLGGSSKRFRRAAGIQTDQCSASPYCVALGRVYCNMPNYIDNMEHQLCAMLNNLGSIGHLLDGICVQFAEGIKAQLVAQFRQALQQKGQEFGCNFGNC